MLGCWASHLGKRCNWKSRSSAPALITEGTGRLLKSFSSLTYLYLRFHFSFLLPCRGGFFGKANTTRPSPSSWNDSVLFGQYATPSTGFVSEKMAQHEKAQAVPATKHVASWQALAADAFSSEVPRLRLPLRVSVTSSTSSFLFCCSSARHAGFPPALVFDHPSCWRSFPPQFCAWFLLTFICFLLLYLHPFHFLCFPLLFCIRFSAVAPPFFLLASPSPKHSCYNLSSPQSFFFFFPSWSLSIFSFQTSFHTPSSLCACDKQSRFCICIFVGLCAND